MSLQSAVRKAKSAELPTGAAYHVRYFTFSLPVIMICFTPSSVHTRGMPSASLSCVLWAVLQYERSFAAFREPVEALLGRSKALLQRFQVRTLPLHSTSISL